MRAATGEAAETPRRYRVAMRRFILPVLAASAFSLLVAAPASSDGISKSEVQSLSLSLSLSDMPTGWSVDNSTSEHFRTLAAACHHSRR